jgi:hypothetical protein
MGFQIQRPLICYPSENSQIQMAEWFSIGYWECSRWSFRKLQDDRGIPTVRAYSIICDSRYRDRVGNRLPNVNVSL